MGQGCCSSKKGGDKLEDENMTPTADLSEAQINRAAKEPKDADKKSKTAGPKRLSAEQQFQKYLDTGLNYDLKKDVLDVDGSLMKFDFFLEFQKQAYMWNRILFAPTKKQLLAERRTLMATGADPARYKLLCITVGTQDEMCLQGVLNKMLDKISLTDEDFQKSLLRHMGDPGKVQKVKDL